MYTIIAKIARTLNPENLEIDPKLPFQTKKTAYVIINFQNLPLHLQTALMKPVSRWQQIRDAVAGLESEIWHFRTRTGKYEHQARTSVTQVAYCLFKTLLVL